MSQEVSCVATAEGVSKVLEHQRSTHSLPTVVCGRVGVMLMRKGLGHFMRKVGLILVMGPQPPRCSGKGDFLLATKAPRCRVGQT